MSVKTKQNAQRINSSSHAAIKKLLTNKFVNVFGLLPIPELVYEGGKRLTEESMNVAEAKELDPIKDIATLGVCTIGTITEVAAGTAELAQAGVKEADKWVRGGGIQDTAKWLYQALTEEEIEGEAKDFK